MNKIKRLIKLWPFHSMRFGSIDPKYYYHAIRRFIFDGEAVIYIGWWAYETPRIVTTWEIDYVNYSGPI